MTNHDFKERLFQDQLTEPCAVLDFNGIKISIASKEALRVDSFYWLEEQVTGLTVHQPEDATDEVDGNVRFVNSPDISSTYDPESRTLVVCGPVEKFNNGSALTYACQYLAECQRAARSKELLIHAAAVSYPGEEGSLLIMGDKGAGKTTIALRLCHQHGYGLVGNDQAYLKAEEDGLKVGPGNLWFDIRETAIASDPYIRSLVSINRTPERAAWNNKIRVTPEELGLRGITNQLEVRRLLHVRIDHSQPGIHAAKWLGVQRNLLVHEKIGRHISGQATPLLDDQGEYFGSLPPIEPERTFAARDQIVHAIIETGITEIFANNSDLAVDYIINGGEV